jgi:serine/threonine protein kinase
MSETPRHSFHQAPIATGGYGCVYRPSIGCQGPLNANEQEQAVGSVAKLQKVSPMSENEIRIGNMVSKLPGSLQYFVTPDATCTTAAYLFPSSLKSGCPPIANSRQTPEELVVMRMRDVPHEKLGTLKNNATPDEIQTMLRNLIVGLPHCLEGIMLLQTAKQPIVHFDLKADNIFAPITSELPLIADFGISFLPKEQTYESIKKTIIAYEPSYFVWPPEIHLLCYILHGRNENPDVSLTEQEMEAVAERVAISNPLLTNDAVSTQKRQAEVLGFYNSLTPATGKSVFEYIISNWQKIDVYSISMCFATIFNAYELGQNNDYLTPLAELLLRGTSANAVDRPSIGKLTITARKSITGSSMETIEGLLSVKEKATINRGTAAATLRGTARTLGRITTRIDSVVSTV